MRIKLTLPTTSLWLALAVLAAACDLTGGDTPAVPSNSCAFALGTEAALHVSQSCGVDGADGSVARPYRTLAEAAAAAEAGDTIALAPGAYVGGVELAGGVKVVGLIDEHVSVSASGEHVLKFTGKGSSEVRGVTVSGAAARGIMVDGSAISLGGVHVKDVGGVGVYVIGADAVDLIGSRITGSAGVGLIVKGSGKVGIIDPTYSPSPRGIDSKVGIIDPTYAPNSVIAGNKGGGVAIIDPTYSPIKSDEVTVAHLLVKATDIDGNGGFGIALYGAGALIERSAIRNTAKGAKGPWADGILITMGATNEVPDLRIDAGSVVLDNARTGVLVMSAARVALEGDVSGNGFCGAWVGAQGARFDALAKATLHRNRMVGITASKGADLRITGATITGTRIHTIDGPDGKIDVADGIGVYDGARATVTNARIEENARAAVVVHAAATVKDVNGDEVLDVIIEGCTMKANGYGIIVNGAPEPPAYAAANSRDDGDGHKGTGAPAPGQDEDGNLGVQTEFCSGENSDEAGCAPSVE